MTIDVDVNLIPEDYRIKQPDVVNGDVVERRYMTYRSEPEDISRPIHFDLALLGYTDKLSRKGIKQIAENNKEQVEKLKWNSYDCELYLNDGTRIKAIGYSERWLHGYKFDQLILFDDDRWKIDVHKNEAIRMIKACTMYASDVPEEFQILRYEDIR